LIDSESFKEYFHTIFKDATLAELRIPTQITATDMVRGRLKYLSQKPKLVMPFSVFCISWNYIAFGINGDLYSDGGILNHFPTDVLQGQCDNIIVFMSVLFKKIEAKDLNSIRAVTSELLIFFLPIEYAKINICEWVIEPKELAITAPLK
jgi:NTE family protein